MSQLTGAQIFAARRLLRWSPRTLANVARLRISVIMYAEADPGAPKVSAEQSEASRCALEAAGIELGSNGPPQAPATAWLRDS
ncbi:transcriptional regulator [Methylobacterium durans]|uniref:Transcriptional regulator n=1 Tax=Methylobacterium durans TaxID=2202825 RepID=A0A2U8W1Z3_9HYPH|nr:transcriptional regulator [Methylobacterium durans]